MDELKLVFHEVAKSRCSANILGEFLHVDRRRIAEATQRWVPLYFFGQRWALRNLLSHVMSEMDFDSQKAGQLSTVCLSPPTCSNQAPGKVQLASLLVFEESAKAELGLVFTESIEHDETKTAARLIEKTASGRARDMKSNYSCHVFRHAVHADGLGHKSLSCPLQYTVKNDSESLLFCLNRLMLSECCDWRSSLSDAYMWVLQVLRQDNAEANSKALRLMVSCPSRPANFLLVRFACALHKICKPCSSGLDFYSFYGDLYCNVKLLSAPGSRKAAIDLAEALALKSLTYEEVHAGSEDALKPAKLKLMSFARRALRHRSGSNEQMLQDLVALDTSDWRDRSIRVRYSGLHAPTSAHKLVQVLLDVVYGRSWSTPVPSKFRGSWEAAVENLLGACLPDLHGQTCEHMLGGSTDLAQTLAKLTAAEAGCGEESLVTSPESISSWNAERALRAGRVRQFMSDPLRARKLWRTVQIVEPVYAALQGLMAQPEFRNFEEARQAQWSAMTMARKDDRNPWLRAMSSLWELLSNESWYEYGLFFDNLSMGADLPLDDVISIECQLLTVNAHLFFQFVHPDATFDFDACNPLFARN